MIQLVAESLNEFYNPKAPNWTSTGTDQDFDGTHKAKKPKVEDDEKDGDDPKILNPTYVGGDNASGIGGDGKIAYPHKPIGAEDMPKHVPFSDKPAPRSTFGSHVPLPKSKALKGEYYPREGTAPWHVMQFFEDHKGEKFSTYEIFQQVGDSAAIMHGIEYLVKKGLVNFKVSFGNTLYYLRNEPKVETHG